MHASSMLRVAGLWHIRLRTVGSTFGRTDHWPCSRRPGCFSRSRCPCLRAHTPQSTSQPRDTPSLLLRDRRCAANGRARMGGGLLTGACLVTGGRHTHRWCDHHRKPWGQASTPHASLRGKALCRPAKGPRPRVSVPLSHFWRLQRTCTPSGSSTCLQQRTDMWAHRRTQRPTEPCLNPSTVSRQGTDGLRRCLGVHAPQRCSATPRAPTTPAMQAHRPTPTIRLHVVGCVCAVMRSSRWNMWRNMRPLPSGLCDRCRRSICVQRRGQEGVSGSARAATAAGCARAPLTGLSASASSHV